MPVWLCELWLRVLKSQVKPVEICCYITFLTTFASVINEAPLSGRYESAVQWLSFVNQESGKPCGVRPTLRQKELLR